jgi:putative ABC transport system substrate-binding protein
MRRRDFIKVIAGFGAAWPLAARAQQSERMHRIGIRRVGLLTSSDAAGRRGSLVQALEGLGYRDGQNLVLEVRSADGRLDRLPALADELTRAGIELIVTVTSPSTQAAIATGTKIPIVMALVGDPVGTGFVQSLNRPGGTVTGVSNASGELAAKRLGLLKEAIPAARRIAVFTHPDDPVAAVQIRQVETAAGPLGVEIKIFPVVASREDIARAVAAAVDWRGDAVLRILAQTAPELSRFQAELLLKHRMPAMVGIRVEVENGGLMTYFADVSEHWTNVGRYVDRILKGAAPGELPVMQPTKFQLILNLKTARALGLTLPPSILGLADEVIE